MFDVYISHNHESPSWAITLANNLKRSGFTVWLDLLQQQPVDDLTREKALSEARHGVLLVTPHACYSDWLQRENSSMIARTTESPEFSYSALTFGNNDEASWISEENCIDFSKFNPSGYRAAFVKLLAILRQHQLFGFSDVPFGLETPVPLVPNLQQIQTRKTTLGENRVAGEIFNKLMENLPVLLLSPADYDQTPVVKALLHQARIQFREEMVFYALSTLGDAEASKLEYFAYLCNQIAPGRNLNKPSDFESFIQLSLSKNRTVFLLIEGLEGGNPDARRALANSLRNLSERYYDWLKIVLCGGGELLSLRYKEGNLSPLRKAVPIVLPELTIDDIVSLRDATDNQINPHEAEVILRVTGGNLRLVKQCLRGVVAGLRESLLREKVLRDKPIAHRFQEYKHSGDITRVAQLLNREVLGHYEVWPIQSCIRKLYWDGLLREREGRFCWRSDTIRQIGIKVIVGEN